jgi:hypothetical protein
MWGSRWNIWTPFPSPWLKACFIFTFRDVDKYDLDVLRQHAKIDYYMALEMTSEILLLEMIHRIVVCLFEVRIWHSEHTKRWRIPPLCLARCSKFLLLTLILVFISCGYSLWRYGRVYICGWMTWHKGTKTVFMKKLNYGNFCCF